MINNMYSPQLKDIQWSEEKEPDNEVRYNYIKGKLGRFEFTIEWKGWKDYDPPVLYTQYGMESYIDSYHSVEEAKAGAREWLKDLLEEITE